MKSRFEPANLALIGIVVAPPACALNATLAALVTGTTQFLSGAGFFVMSWCGALLICFPLGLISECIGNHWVACRAGSARRLALASSLVAALCLKPLIPNFADKDDYPLAAGLLIPLLWSMLFPLFAIFARPPRP